MQKNQIIIILSVIVVIGTGFRLWSLANAELTFDEGLDAFRSIGYLDYLESAAQPTLVQLLGTSPLPWWTKLSFHDHPPLFFIIQWLSFTMLGDTLFAARFPSAIAGTIAIMLMFFIVRRLLHNDRAGLIAATLISTSFAAVFVSRLAMIESVLIAFILLNILMFLRFLENPCRWAAFGATFGLVLLTKYTGIFLLPAYLSTIAVINPALYRDWRVYAAAGLTLVIFSPVIIYNIMLYNTLGHFDLQFSYLFDVMPAYWQGESGKTQEPFTNIVANLRALYSPTLLLLGAIGFTLSALTFRKQKLLAFPLFAALSVTLLLVATGSAPRFTALYLIPLLPLTTYALLLCFERFPKQRFPAALLGIVIAIEAAFTIRYEFKNAADYGIVELDRYFNNVFGAARPNNVPRHPNPNLDAVIQNRLARIPATLPPSGIIYDDNLAIGPMLWLFSRRQYYHGIPIMPASAFLETQKFGHAAMFNNVTLYFVKAGDGAPLKRARAIAAEKIERALATKGMTSIFSTADNDNVTAFTVYTFTTK